MKKSKVEYAKRILQEHREEEKQVVAQKISEIEQERVKANEYFDKQIQEVLSDQYDIVQTLEIIPKKV